MNSTHLSKRLSQVYDFVVSYAAKPCRLADIGTDHAYLPCALALEGEVTFAVAGDVAAGPLASAKEEVSSQGLEDKISVRLGDGLAVVEASDRINTVTICGMGGRLMRDILEAGVGRLEVEHTLVLQANVGNYALRTWLDEAGYEILDEAVMQEGKHFYEVIACVERPGKVASLSDKERLMGPKQLQKQGEAFRLMWADEAQALRYVQASLQQAKQPNLERLQEIQQQLTYIEEELGK